MKRTSCFFGKKTVIVSLLFLLLGMLPLCLSSMAAEPTAILLPKEITDLFPENQYLLLDDASNDRLWFPLQGTSLSSLPLSENSFTLSLTAPDAHYLGIYRTLSAPVGTRTELVIPFHYSGSGAANLFLTVNTTQGKLTSVTTIAAEGSSSLIVNLEKFRGTQIQSMMIELIGEPGTAVNEFRVFPLYLESNFLFSSLRSHQMILLPEENTRLRWKDSSFEVSSENEESVFMAMYESVQAREGYLVCRITVPENESEAYLHVYAYDSLAGRIPLRTMKLSPGTHLYYVPVSLEDTAGYLFSVRSASAPIRFDSFLFAEEPIREDSEEISLGQVTSCRILPEDRLLSVSGRIDSKSIVDYMENASLILVETDASGDTVYSQPLASSPISIRFSFSVPMDSLTLSRSYYRVYIQSGSERIPVDEPFVPRMESQKLTPAPVAFARITTAEAFSANVPAVLVQVSLNRLLGDNKKIQNIKICLYQDRIYSIDADYVKELNQEIAFYQSAGIRVYLKWVCSSAIEGLPLTLTEDHGLGLCVDATSEDGRCLLGALSEMILSQFGKIDGVVLGNAWDDPFQNLTNYTNLDDYVDNLYRAVDLIYRISLPYQSDLQLLLPFAMKEGEDFSDAGRILTKLSRRLSRNGGIPYSLLLVSDSDTVVEDYISFSERIPKQDLDPESVSALISLPANAGSAAQTLESKLDWAQNNPWGTFFFQMNSETGKEFWASAEKTIRDHTTQSTLLYPADTSFPGTGVSVSLWDFSTSFDAQGWITDGTFSEPLTAAHPSMASYLGLSSLRTLTVSLRDKKTSGVILCSVEEKFDLSDVAAVSFTLMAQGTGTMNLRFVFGNDVKHTEYSASLPADTPVSLLCDLTLPSDIGPILYVAIVCDENVQELAIADISAHSASATEEELRLSLGIKNNEEEPSGRLPLPVLWIGALLMMITIVVFLILEKRKK